jgi:3-hydroxybutyryl-CoA dehydrogenase
MGGGIAQLFLGAGCAVHLHDVEPQRALAAVERIRAGLQKWEARGRIASAGEAMERLVVAPNLIRLQGCDWVVEAIVEELVAKEEVFRTLGRLCDEATVLASNTSSLSITRLGAASGRPGRVLGMHFFNPPAVMALVEVVPGLATDPGVVDAARRLAEQLGKTPVVSQDRPGFIANRLLAPMLNEAIYALSEGIAGAPEIDRVMKLGANHPMGPLELADLIGLDVLLAILEVLHREMGDPKYRPCPLLRRYVEAGWLGRKTGRGFFSYE